VGITVMTLQATRAYEIADEFHRRGRKVVLGGVHASMLPG
jgi:bacteriochlorophyll C8 methyltransferase